MNRKLHLILVLGCVIVAALDAPRAGRLFSEGLAGPYEESAQARPAAAEAVRASTLAPARRDGDPTREPRLEPRPADAQGASAR